MEFRSSYSLSQIDEVGWAASEEQNPTSYFKLRVGFRYLNPTYIFGISLD
jgi:hypothetical protein